MYLRNAWIPAIAGLALIVGCDSKPSDTVPTTAPMAAKEPFELLPHMKYIAVRKDYKDIPVIAPADLNGLYGNAWWFHNHAGQIDLTLTDDEIKGVGAEEVAKLGYIAPNASMSAMQLAMDKLQAREINALPDAYQGVDLTKLDKLPDQNNKQFAKDYPTLSGPLLRPAYNAGLLRLLKGIPAEMWNEVAILKTSPIPNRPQETSLVLGYHGTPILELTARQKADKTYGIIYMHYMVQPKVLAKAATQPKK